MMLDEDENLIVEKYDVLDEMYIKWVELVGLLRAAPEDKKESLAEESEKLFKDFFSEFERILPQMKKSMFEDFNRTMEIDITGLEREYIKKISLKAKEFSIGTILEERSIILCAGPKIDKDPDFEILENKQVSKNAEDQASEEPETMKVSKIKIKSLISAFKDVPDPVELLSIKEIFPEENKIEFQLTPPEDYGCPILLYFADAELTYNDGAKVMVQSEMEGLVNPSIVLNNLENLRILSLSVRPRNSYGIQIKSKTWKFLLPKRHEAVWMFGKNDYNQIDTELVSEEVNEAISSNEENEYYCSKWAKLEFKGTKLRPIKAVSRNTTLAVVNNCEIVQWGLNRVTLNGEVEEQPTQMFLHPRILVNCISLGNTFCVLSTVEGRVYSWGDNRFGQLGLGNFTSIEEKPTLVHGLKDRFVVDIRSGFGHTVCLDDQGMAYSWGQSQALAGKPVLNRFGDRISYINKGIHQPAPFAISKLSMDSGEKVVSIASGEFQLGMVTSKGGLFMWGENDEEILGDYPAVSSAVPIRILLEGSAKKVQIGFNHCVVEVFDEGETKFKAWGLNKKGQCGLASSGLVKSPTEITQVKGKQIAKFWCGTERTYFVEYDGKLWVCGRSFEGLKESSGHQLSLIREDVTDVYESNGTIVVMS